MSRRHAGVESEVLESSSPYPFEPPRRQRAVSAILGLLGKNTSQAATPHLYGGSDEAKVEYELGGADAFLRIVAPHLDPTRFRDKDVLDAGCGWGGKAIFYAQHLGVRSILGFDLPGVFRPQVPERCARERGLTQCRFTVGYAESMPVDDASFDLVLSDDVLEHVQDPAQVLRECHRALRPGGTVIASFPSFKMFHAHHLDRALTLPAAHYLLPLDQWASGLNHLLAAGELPGCEPFDEIVDTPFRKGVTRNLNGMDFTQFRGIVRDSGFRTVACELVPFRPRNHAGWKARLYRQLWRNPLLREFLAQRILFIGEKPAAA